MLTNNFGYSQEPKSMNYSENLSSKSADSLNKNSYEKDSISNDSIKKQEGTLNEIVNYSATDYTSINQKTKQIYLYNEAQIQYENMDIQSGVIIIDYGKDLIYAGRLKDSLGIYSQAPVFKQGMDIVRPDSIVFNIKTKKALIWNSKTEQQGG